jgi:hypothetical protein
MLLKLKNNGQKSYKIFKKQAGILLKLIIEYLPVFYFI